MAQAPIRRPQLYSSPGTAFPAVTREALGDASNTFAAQQIVKVSSGALAAYVADDTAVYGLTPDASHTATEEPFNSLYAQQHNPISLSGQRLIMNITDGSGTVGSGSTTQADVSIGTLYSARYLATVDTSCLGLDASDAGTATKNIFKVVAKYDSNVAPDGDASGDFNGRVIVEVLATAIQ